MSCFRECQDGVLLDMKAFPGSSVTEIKGERGGRLLVRIAAVAEDGKANAALIAFLAKKLHIAKKSITFVSGEKSRLKTLHLPKGSTGIVK
jgi:uncharacterized protein (TIGR00251 family)